MSQNEPKWTVDQTSEKGKQAVELTIKYRSDLENNQQKEIDKRWAKEGESRIDAYNDGLLEDIPISRVIEEIERSEGKL
jgi:hypothetical protein